ncbi:DNA binding protein [Streptococcus phage P9853]|uniref:DNA binding protein n=1 Tax=Streptococcus phage P9853 TaxID=1971445 RepID=A0A286QRW1_9CAUD|nr:DNA binding protein [Streptococcus phage P9853]ARU14641.1 DNA binding protein [Streptococcus phage P9853]
MNRLKELRKQKKLTIVELAEKILTILNWEHGTREIKGSNAKKFNVSIPYLLGYDTDNTFSDLITKINHWADERNLKQADPKIQWMRITEEVGEIRDVLLKPTKFTDPQMALKDAIGDTLVTIIVLAHQLDLDVTECLSIAYEEIKNRKGKMVNGTFVKEEDL